MLSTPPFVPVHWADRYRLTSGGCELSCEFSLQNVWRPLVSWLVTCVVTPILLLLFTELAISVNSGVNIFWYVGIHHPCYRLDMPIWAGSPETLQQKNLVPRTKLKSSWFVLSALKSGFLSEGEWADKLRKLEVWLIVDKFLHPFPQKIKERKGTEI